MAKTLMFTATGAITPSAGVNTVEVTDPGDPRGIVVEGMLESDLLILVRQNYAADGWEVVTDGDRHVQLNSRSRREVLLVLPGIYGLQGNVEGTVTAYSVAPA